MMMSVLWRKVAPFLGLILVMACSDSFQIPSKNTAAFQPEHEINSMLSDSLYFNNVLDSRCAIQEFYASRNYTPLWFKKDEMTQQGDSLLKILSDAAYYGLMPENYHFARIEDLAKTIAVDTTKAPGLAELDLLMTDGFFTLAHDVRFGRFNKDIFTRRESLPGIDSSILSVLTMSLSKNSLTTGLQTLEPAYTHYKMLKKDLQVKLDSLPLALNDSGLNVRLKQHIQSLSITMEQWRWENSNSEQPYILVNIPSYQLEVMENDSLIFESNVVVGTPSTQTPTLDAKVHNVVVYPYWTVPREIATKELLPKIKSDAAYLAAHNYRVLDVAGNEVVADSIDWRACHANNFPYVLQQTEGEHNALGIVKFNFVNDYNVYLHDTNAKRFFNASKRAYSHGCVRVERAIELANLLVAKNSYGVSNINGYVKAGEQHMVNIKPVEIRIRYFTCHAGQDGKVHYFDDVYQKNAAIFDALYCQDNGEYSVIQ